MINIFIKMVNYQNGKLYKIHSLIDDRYYIGSTTQLLHKRFATHKGFSKTEMATPIQKAILEIGAEHWMITLIENVPCNTKEELLKMEREEYLKYKDDANCLNVLSPIRHLDDFKEYKAWKDKTYREKHKDELCIKKKEYRDNNIEKIKSRNAKYREINRDIINKKQRETRQKQKNEQEN